MDNRPSTLRLREAEEDRQVRCKLLVMISESPRSCRRQDKGLAAVNDQRILENGVKQIRRDGALVRSWLNDVE